MEELGERGDKESRDRDKERTDATSAAWWRHSEYPAGMDAAGKLTDNDLCPVDFMPLGDEQRTSVVSSEFYPSATSAF